MSAGHDRFVSELRRAREEARLPSHARVVAWGLPGTPTEQDLAHLPEMAPLLAAGFQIDAVVSPAQAMARLVNARKIDTSRTAVAVVALNAHGVAMAVVSNGDAISSRTFEWPLGRPFAGNRDELLERYLVVSQVAPQLKHVIDLVRPVYGVTVTSILVCGNLPNLRSLTMPLIEEMDIEIETLDSIDLLESGDGIPADAVPALQLAAAVALPAQAARVAHEPAAAASDDNRALSALRRTSLLAALTIAGVWSLQQFAGSSPAAPFFPDGVALAAAPSTSPIPAAELRPEATMGRVREAEVAPAAPPVAMPAAVPAAVATRVEPPVSPDPLPRVDGIMIAGERRMAIVDGAVVVPGDRIGARTLARIERDGVVLREPSGREVHVAIRMRR